MSKFELEVFSLFHQGHFRTILVVVKTLTVASILPTTISNNMAESRGSEAILSELILNEARFLDLLEKLIGESEFLQNSPPQGLIPNEDRASDHILKVLEPFMKKNGGVLEVERVSFVEGLCLICVCRPASKF